MAKKYVLNLPADEREKVEKLVKKGKVRKALSNCHKSSERPGWTD